MKKTVTIRNIVIGDGQPKICVPLVGSTEEEIVRELGAFAPGSFLSAADAEKISLAEFRADHFHALDNYEALDAVLGKVREAIGDRVLLFTIRSAREGGCWREDSDSAYYDINRHVIERELADLVDLELFSEDREEIRSLITLAHEHGRKVIMSNHEFERTPENAEMEGRLREMESLGADIAKLAVMPNSKSDVTRLMELTTRLTEDGMTIPVVTMSMGEIGAVSRITGGVTGSAITFASLEKSSAPGQLPVAELANALDIMRTLTQ